jgi:hypothetical protein
MNLIGYNLSGPDNGTYMFRDRSGLKRCPLCGYRLDFISHNPDYQFRRREADQYDGYVKRGADFSSTYDMYKIVSDRFRAFCMEQEYTYLAFGEFSKDKSHFNFVANRIVEFDAVRRVTNFEKLCCACGNYESVVGAKPAYLLRSKPLEDGFYRSDLLFGSGDSKGPLILVGIETREKLKAAKLKGLEFSPAFGWD